MYTLEGNFFGFTEASLVIQNLGYFDILLIS